MSLLFTYIVTGLLIVLGLMSLGNDFPYTPLYIALALMGLGVSFWQQKKKPIPYLRSTANIILVILTVKALFPFFVGRLKQDMVTILITTWAYFLILFAFIIYTKRDYYIIQGLALGLIVYACFYATHNPLPLLGYTAAFLAIWIMALRNINLFRESKEEKTIFYTTRDIWREIKLGAILFFAIVIISLPFYFLLPRFNIPLLPMDKLLRQRYSTIYADFPKRGLVVYLSRNPGDIMTPKKGSEGKVPSLAQKGGREAKLDIRQNIKKPIFWHGQEAIDNLTENIQKINQGLKDLAQQNKLPEIEKNIQEHQKLLEQEEKINEEKKELEKALQMKVTQDQKQKFENKLKDLDTRLQKIEEAKSQIRASVYKQALLISPEIRRLWDKKEELENQLKALAEQIKNLSAQQQAVAPQQQPKTPEEKPENQKEIEKLEQKIQKTNEELKDLAQQSKLPEVKNYIQQHQNLLAQEEKINEEKKELEKALQEAKEEYLEMAQIQSNPPQELAANPEALKELKDKMEKSEDKIENIINERKIMDKQIEKIKEIILKIRESIYKQSAQSTQKIRILWDKKEEQHEELQKLKQEGEMLASKPEEPPEEIERKPKPPPPPLKKTTRQITILDIFLYILIISTIIYVIRSILAFISPYLKHKQRILLASSRGQYNLSISLIYNFLGRVLYIFGYKYPVVVLPEEYLKAINKRFAAISHYTNDLTDLFIEARYSSHQLNPGQEKQAFENYRNILQELKNSSVAWQRQILKMGFLFEL